MIPARKITKGVFVKNYAIGCAVALASVSAHAAFLDGVWEMKSGPFNEPARTCSSGAAPDDAFKEGRDSATIEILGSAAVITTTIDGVTDVDSAGVDQKQMILDFVNAEGKSLKVPMALRGANELYIYESNFGPGGTCPVGDTMRAHLKRKK
jgi:hypothetical protein